MGLTEPNSFPTVVLLKEVNLTNGVREQQDIKQSISWFYSQIFSRQVNLENFRYWYKG